MNMNFSFNTEYNLLKRVKKLYTAGMKPASGAERRRRLNRTCDCTCRINDKKKEG